MSVKRFAQDIARSHQERLGRMWQTAVNIAAETGDKRWDAAATALREAQRVVAELTREARQ